MINPPPESGNGMLHGLEMALKRDSIVRAVWSVGGVAKRLGEWLAEQTFATLTVGTLTATDITASTLEATTSIETVDLTVTGTATLPGGGEERVVYSVTSSAQTLATNDTVTLVADKTVHRVTSPAAATGVRMPAGSVNGEKVIILNEGSTAFDFHTTEATARIAGSTLTLPGDAHVELLWLTVDSLWHRPM